MRELPILFSTPMVQAILENRKTMTRRTQGLEEVNENNDLDSTYFQDINEKGNFIFYRHGTKTLCAKGFECKSRYQVGDHLWVKETFNIADPNDIVDGEYIGCETGIIGSNHGKEIKWRYVYKATSPENHPTKGKLLWKSSMFMPKSAARIWLEVTKVRCERLMDITEADAKAEGAAVWNPARDIKFLEGSKSNLPKPCGPFKFSFILLWCKINGVESFDLNPWVFVYEFKRIEKQN